MVWKYENIIYSKSLANVFDQLLKVFDQLLSAYEKKYLRIDQKKWYGRQPLKKLKRYGLC